jgi:hypothetical protein
LSLDGSLAQTSAWRPKAANRRTPSKIRNLIKLKRPRNSKARELVRCGYEERYGEIIFVQDVHGHHDGSCSSCGEMEVPMPDILWRQGRKRVIVVGLSVILSVQVAMDPQDRKRQLRDSHDDQLCLSPSQSSWQFHWLFLPFGRVLERVQRFRVIHWLLKGPFPKDRTNITPCIHRQWLAGSHEIAIGVGRYR